MSVVKKASNSNVVRKKPTTQKSKVQSVRQPSEITEMGDTSFGTLDEAKDGLLVAYDANLDKFVLITADDLLIRSVEDEDLPDEFIDELEQELDLGQIAVGDIDGGSF